MADPLSIAAGIITVIGAAEAVAKGLGKLISLKGLPSTFVALNNEISDLRLVVQEVDGFLLDNGQLSVHGRKICESSVNGIKSLQSNLDNAKGKLLALERMITHDLTNADGSPDRFKWLREENKLRRLQEDNRNLRLNIGTALGILTSTMTTKIHMQLQELQLITERGQALTIQNFEQQRISAQNTTNSMAQYRQRTDDGFAQMEHYLQGLLNPKPAQFSKSVFEIG